MDGQAKLVRQGHEHAPFCSAVELCHYEAGDICKLLKFLRLHDCVLSRCGIENQQGVVGGVRVFLADDPDNLGELFHQVGPVLQPPGGINHQEISALGLSLAERIESKAGGITALGRRQHGHTGPLPPNLQLLHSRRAESVAGGNHHLLACCPKLGRKLSDRGGFARAVYPHHKHNLRFLRIERQRARHRRHHPCNFIAQGQLDLSRRHAAAITPLCEVGGDARSRIHPHVRGDQQFLDFFQHVVIENTPGGLRPAPTHDPSQQTRPRRRWLCIVFWHQLAGRCVQVGKRTLWRRGNVCRRLWRVICCGGGGSLIHHR